MRARRAICPTAPSPNSPSPRRHEHSLRMAHPRRPARRCYDPPYTHQATALEYDGAAGASLVVTTGTGSGKTETFLLPILAKLAAEAPDTPSSFETPALRAILLYPMNTLVNDQLARLRLLFGDPAHRRGVHRVGARPARFGTIHQPNPVPGSANCQEDQVHRALLIFHLLGCHTTRPARKRPNTT